MLASPKMRAFVGLVAVALAGCGGTVYRLPGEPLTPGGPAETACESEDWLVIAPTRAEVASESKKTSHPENGLGIYKVGSSSPESIPSIEGLDSPSIQQKRKELEPYDRKQIIAGSLGVAGLIAITVGTILFVNAFETTSTVDAMGLPREKNSVNGTRAGLGGAFVGVGFGLGIAGLVVNPNNGERTQARATRHVFFNPPDDPKSVEKLVGDHNAQVRSRCAAGH
jgi:hypothetical protein